MSKKSTLRDVAWIAAGVITVVVVMVFAAIDREPADPQSAPQTAAPGGLESVVKSAQTWEATFPAWAGKAAPDFAINDIDGKTHRLSDYHGKNLLVVFWATWCPSCNAEIPHLMELRKAYSADQLAILAISNESPDVLKDFVAKKGINYTVASIHSTPPAPFSSVTSIPTTFYIGPDGKIKLTALGLVPLEQAKAIVDTHVEPSQA
ncbi:MAG: TlpA disulfide reductase family protein [Sedimentisphaerales bacterium]|jgi:peroxiredoxin